jgi:glyoxylase-like metal-dependent hydrolase (beta-lactamase superfamily II)
MIVESFPVGPLGANCTILGDETTHEALVIDPGGEPERIYRRLQALRLEAQQILLTHGHLDHAAGVAKLKKLTGAPVLIHHADLPQLEHLAEQAGWLGMEAPKKTQPDEYLADGQVVGLKSLPVTVLYTPGHTQGCVCLYLKEQNLLISGDTLFAGSIGRTDLPGGDSSQIIDSIKTRLLVLPDETRVITGHGPETTIGEERQGNPFLQGRFLWV